MSKFLFKSILLSYPQNRKFNFGSFEVSDLQLKSGDRISIIFENTKEKEDFRSWLFESNRFLDSSILSEGLIQHYSDYTLGFNDEANVYQNIIIKGILVGGSKRIIEQNIEEILIDSKLTNEKFKQFRKITPIQKLLLGFNIQKLFSDEIIIVNEWPAIIDKKEKINTSDELLNLFLKADISFFLTINHSSIDPLMIKKLKTQVYFMKNGCLIKNIKKSSK
jgi:lipopolysaccharide transport system ATP-binding protein